MTLQETTQQEMQGPLPFVQGWEWVKEGFRFFSASPLAWILCTIIMMALLLVLSFLPLVSILVYLVSPVLYGGLMIGCRAIDSGAPLEIRHLFAGFRENTQTLATIGGLQLLGMIVVAVVVGGIGFTMIGQTTPDVAALNVNPAMMIVMLLGVALTLPIAMAVWFAPALVALDGIGALAAMKMSFRACLLNLLAFTGYSLVLLLLMLLVAATFGIGFVVVIPVVIASVYASYRDIFRSDDLSESGPIRS